MTTDQKASGWRDSPRHKAFEAVAGMRAPFCLGYGRVRYRGHNIEPSRVETFYVSRWSIAPLAASLAAMLLSWEFFTVPYLGAMTTALLGTNSFLMAVGYFRPNGYRLLVLQTRDGRRMKAFVGAWTAETMVEMWDDIVRIMPDLVGRAPL